MLFTVNYESKKVLIDGQLVECGRGQAVLSLDGWLQRFGVSKKAGGWTIQKVRTFFNLLEKDQMINKENLVKTTRITICNYDVYQGEQHENNTTVTAKQQEDNNMVTKTKEYKEIKKKERVVFTPPTLPEIQSYFAFKIAEKQLPLKAAIEAEKFLSHYSSNGWQIGRNKMKDWKAAINGWVAREKGKLNGTPQLNERHTPTKLKAI
ncbi:MAG: hypothetical protein RBT74_17415 [Tenuifilaceae bacterium]|jgi:hypothetical protein|nr:hypothetical protein [Tenuifilaceae bacterium]